MSFQIHLWIQTNVAVWKRSNLIKIGIFLSRVTLTFDGWPCKTIGHIFYAMLSFVHHFETISDFKLQVAEDDNTFKLAIFLKKSLPLNDNAGFCSIIQASELVFGSLLAKKPFFVQFWTKKCCILLDGQLWEWFTGGMTRLQPKCNWSVGFAIAWWPVGKASDKARIMLFNLFRYSLV